MNYLPKILKTTAFVLITSLTITGCSKENDTLEIQEGSLNLKTNIENQNQDASRAPGFNRDVEYLNSEHPDYIRNMNILIAEGVEMLTSNDAIKTTDENGNVTYLFIDERDEFYGTLYVRGKYRGSLKYMHNVNPDGRDQLILSNIRGNRTMNVLSVKDIASKLPGGATEANRTYAQCVSQLTSAVFYGTLTGPPPHNSIVHAYAASVVAVNGIVLWCAGETAVCALFGC